MNSEQLLIKLIAQGRITDLHGENLKNADLKNADLKNANLECVNLEAANLEGANLKGADLERADLESANLGGANLEGAFLEGANLKGAFLEDANLQGARLRYANLGGAILRNTILRGARLRYANLQDANLQGINLQGAIGMASSYIPHLSTRKDYLYAVAHGDGVMIKAGCYWGEVSDFADKVDERDAPKFRNDLYAASALIMAVGLMVAGEDEDEVSQAAAEAIEAAKQSLMQAYDLLKENK